MHWSHNNLIINILLSYKKSDRNSSSIGKRSLNTTVLKWVGRKSFSGILLLINPRLSLSQLWLAFEWLSCGAAPCKVSICFPWWWRLKHTGAPRKVLIIVSQKILQAFAHNPHYYSKAALWIVWKHDYIYIF